MTQFFEGVDKKYLSETFPKLSDLVRLPLQPAMIQAMLSYCDGDQWTDAKFVTWMKEVYTPEMKALVEKYSG